MLKDSLSALLDGECSGPELDRLLAEWERSPELATQWSRMCLAREAREGTRVRAEQGCICAAVMDRLDEAPAAGGKIIDLAQRRAARRAALATYWKPAVGMAAAASMGAAAVLLVQPAADVGTDGESAVRLANGPEIASWARPVSTAASDLRPVANQDQIYSQMLRDYLMDHNATVAGEGMGHTLRYVRFAAHTAEPEVLPDETN